MTKKEEYAHLRKDILLVSTSIVVSYIFAKFGVDDVLLSLFSNPFIVSFIAGIFFTSLLTIAPASVVLAGLAMHGHPIEIALFGAMGAVVGDMLLFFFVRDSLADDISFLLKSELKHYHLDKLHSKYMRWLLPALGSIIIASPLPDELGIMLLGFSKMKTRNLIAISLVMNFIGVLFVVAFGGLVR